LLLLLKCHMSSQCQSHRPHSHRALTHPRGITAVVLRSLLLPLQCHMSRQCHRLRPHSHRALTHLRRITAVVLRSLLLPLQCHMSRQCHSLRPQNHRALTHPRRITAVVLHSWLLPLQCHMSSQCQGHRPHRPLTRPCCTTARVLGRYVFPLSCPVSSHRSLARPRRIQTMLLGGMLVLLQKRHISTHPRARFLLRRICPLTGFLQSTGQVTGCVGQPDNVARASRAETGVVCDTVVVIAFANIIVVVVLVAVVWNVAGRSFMCAAHQLAHHGMPTSFVQQAWQAHGGMQTVVCTRRHP